MIALLEGMILFSLSVHLNVFPLKLSGETYRNCLVTLCHRTFKSIFLFCQLSYSDLLPLIFFGHFILESKNNVSYKTDFGKSVICDGTYTSPCLFDCSNSFTPIVSHLCIHIKVWVGSFSGANEWIFENMQPSMDKDMRMCENSLWHHR